MIPCKLSPECECSVAMQAQGDIVQALGQARCIEEVQDWETEGMIEVRSATQCRLYLGPPLSEEGFRVIRKPTNAQLAMERSRSSMWVSFPVHRLAYTAATGKNAEYIASHLCGVPDCVEDRHLVDEKYRVHISRRGCPGVITCSSCHTPVLDCCACSFHKDGPKCVRDPAKQPPFHGCRCKPVEL